MRVRIERQAINRRVMPLFVCSFVLVIDKIGMKGYALTAGGGVGRGEGGSEESAGFVETGVGLTINYQAQWPLWCGVGCVA